MLANIFAKISKYGLLKTSSYILSKIPCKYKKNKIRKHLQKESQITKKILDFETEMNFLYNLQSKERILNYYEQNKEIREKILLDSENIMNHNFDLLGSGLVNLGDDINWSQDFKSGYIWKNNFYQDIKVVDLNNNADVKVPWELSRFQHLFTLGKAYWITENKKYFKEAKIEIKDWIDKNPIYLSVNWTCAMDVAIRAVNWIFFYFQFEDAILNDIDFLQEFNSRLYQHGEYIWLNLEKELGFSNNHYLSDLVGLLFIGIFFKNLKEKEEPKKWYKFAIKELEKEINIQVNNDGTNYESSTCYHKLVVELLFFSLLIAEKNNLKFSKNYKLKVKNMFVFLASITKKNGLFPIIGDVDNGRLVILSDYYDWKVNDARELLNLGKRYFGYECLKIDYSKQEAEIILFEDLNKKSKILRKLPLKFSDGGYYILKNNNFYCLIRCGELSCHGLGGHSHNDQLSFELNVKGEDFFVDPGTGVYTPSKVIRNLFRSTAMHNTVSIKNVEQNSFYEDKLFMMQEQTFSKCLCFNEYLFEGEHYGFINKVDSIHKRKIQIYEKYMSIYDTLLETKGIVNLHIASGVQIKMNGETIILKKNGVEIYIDLTGKNFKILDSYISCKYGIIEKSKKIEIYFDRVNEIKILLEN